MLVISQRVEEPKNEGGKNKMKMDENNKLKNKKNIHYINIRNKANFKKF